MAQQMMTARFGALLISVAVLGGCTGIDFDTLDLDLRGNAEGALDTSGAARAATAPRPEPDRFGLITYPTYQVVVAKRGDTVADVANRIGMAPADLARHNGRSTDDLLRADEVLALPRRINPPAVNTTTTPSARPDIGAIAGAAIDRAAPDAATPAAATARVTPRVQGGEEPVQHRVGRGETPYSIARLYGVSVRSLADWNGLGPDLEVREGQYLIIPLVISEGGAEVVATAPAPGAGSSTPVPPSAASALPPPVEEATLPASPNLDATRTAASQTPATPAPTAAPAQSASAAPALSKPVGGSILRPYSKRNEGLDLSATAGEAVKAAADGEVILVTRDTDQTPVIVVSHAGDLKTVYANIADVRVSKGDRVRKGQRLAQVGSGTPAFLRFGVLRGFEAIDPTPMIR